ncbi:MAG: class II aldolase/adducin family protein, partial [Rhodothermaceae bacterium]
MESSIKKSINEFVNAAKMVGRYGLLNCSSGNMSQRLSDDKVLLSKSGSWLAELTDEEVSLCELSSGEILNDKKPTVENLFHRGIMEQREDVNTILHFQSPYATIIACSCKSYFNFNVIAEIPLYIGNIETVPYLVPGSAELADAVVNAAKESDMIIMKNHGLVTVGKDYRDVIQKARFFELACEIMINSNGQVNYLSE